MNAIGTIATICAQSGSQKVATDSVNTISQNILRCTLRL